MKQTAPKSNDRHRAAIAQIARRRKKLLIVFLLFFVMAVLWVRVLVSKNRPQQALAISAGNAADAAAGSTEPEIVYVELPVIADRHNVLACDFFAAGDFKGFRKQGEYASNSGTDTSVMSSKQLSDGMAAAAEKLELIAIVNGKKPQVFIEDKLLEKGQSLKFVFGDQIYEFKVVNILGDRVELECNGIIVTKKIPESVLKTE
ncbi:MAG: hypothetical protein WCE45_09555 [Sedimentisphaerales bacterium]